MEVIIMEKKFYYTFLFRNDKDRLAIRQQDVDFDVSEEDGATTITLKLAERLDSASNTDDPPFNLPKKYRVLGVANDCLLVGFGLQEDGNTLCMLWSPIAGEEIEKSQCLENSTSCANLYDVWESKKNDPCKELDGAEKSEQAEQKQETPV
ncbi:uncharacterized protein [Dermacentor andersoni]|uniref:uncharacterized protein n=1 Tax=Dermacentor andersoni TaxID=34620 RepID=UPI003B3B6871